MTQPKTEMRVIRTFNSLQWDGRSNPRPVNVLTRFRGKRLWAGLAVFIVLTNLGAFGATVIVLAAIGIVLSMIVSTGKLSPQQLFVNDLMADVNETVIELTDNANARLTIKDLWTLRDSDRQVPLPVNGVAGLTMSVISDKPDADRPAAIARVNDTVRTTRITVTATPPDYGTASFDRLLQATIDAD